MEQKKIKLIEPVIGREEIEGVTEVLRSGWLTEGPRTADLEERIREFVGVEHAVATTSCTTALELALRVLDVGPGDEVIVPDFTHPATGNIVTWVGATPVLVDVDLSSYNVDPTEIEKAISKKTKCAIPVSWGGNPLAPKPLSEIRQEHGISIVEDAACGLGAECDGMRTGQLAEITCLSFHPRKIITTGEGGMAITDNADYAEKLRKLKKFGMAATGEVVFTGNGTNYKLSDVLAAIGVKQMEKIEAIINRRIELAEYYDELLSQVDSVKPPTRRANTKHVYQTYAIYIEKEGMRDRLIAHLRRRNIETQIGTYALHLQPSYLGAKKVGKLERAEKLYGNLLALPMCHSMTKQDQERVVSEIKNFLTKRG